MSHYLHHAEILNQLLPAPRKLFHLSGCTKHWRRFPSVSCSSHGIMREPEGASRGFVHGHLLGTACQCFYKDKNSSAREISRGLCPGTAPNVPKHTPCMKEGAAAILSLVVVRTCSFQFLLRSSFQDLAGPRGIISLGPGLARPRAGRWRNLFLQGRDSFRAWHKSLPDRKAALCCCWIPATPEMLQEG